MIGLSIYELGPRVDEVGTIRRLAYDAKSDVAVYVDDLTGYVMLTRHGVIFEAHVAITEQRALEIWGERVEQLGSPIHYRGIGLQEWRTILADTARRNRWSDMAKVGEALFSVVQQDYTTLRKDIRPALLRNMLGAFMDVCRDINEDVRDAIRCTRSSAPFAPHAPEQPGDQ
jgi:hypothetical protein